MVLMIEINSIRLHQTFLRNAN